MRESGRELDMLVAEKVLGFRWRSCRPGASHPDEKDGDYEWLGDARHPQAVRRKQGVIEPHTFTPHLPYYSTDIAAAWEIVERFQKAEKVIGASGGVDLKEEWPFRLQWNHAWMWDARFDHCVDTSSVGTEFTEYFAQAPTAPHAICLAALKAVGVEIG